MKLTCAKCFGNKKYKGMGGMTVKCEVCDGDGEIEVKSDLAPKAKKRSQKEQYNGKEERAS